MKRKLFQDDVFVEFVLTNPTIKEQFDRKLKQGKHKTIDLVELYRKQILCKCSNNANRQACKDILTPDGIRMFLFDEFYSDKDSEERRKIFRMVFNMAHTSASITFDRSVIPRFHYVNRYNCYCWVKKRVHPVRTLPKRMIRWVLRKLWVKIKPTPVGKIIDKIRGKHNDNSTSQ